MALNHRNISSYQVVGENENFDHFSEINFAMIMMKAVRGQPAMLPDYNYHIPTFYKTRKNQTSWK